MYLFRETTDNIETFMIKPNLERVKQFKTNEMEKFPCEGRFLKALGNTNALDAQPTFLNWNFLLECGGDSRLSGSFHTLRGYDFTEEEEKRQEKLLADYYRGCFDDRRVVKIKPYGGYKKEIYGIPKDAECLLLTRDYEIRNLFTMDYIIVLTKPLYLYELIIRAFNEHDYKSIIDQDISSQLQLFDISREPYRVISKNMVQDLFEVGLFGLSKKESNYSEFMDDVRQSGMVLEKSLKYSNKIL